jgi:hypothetical protein
MIYPIVVVTYESCEYLFEPGPVERSLFFQSVNNFKFLFPPLVTCGVGFTP